jgi:hypothetical protein
MFPRNRNRLQTRVGLIAQTLRNCRKQGIEADKKYLPVGVTRQDDCAPCARQKFRLTGYVARRMMQHSTEILPRRKSDFLCLHQCHEAIRVRHEERRSNPAS